MGMKLAVALLIVMAVMNGFKDELTTRLLGINGHLMMMTMGLIALIAGVKIRDWWDNRGPN